MEFRTLVSRLFKSTSLRHVVVDAALGAGCGTLYGIVFGGFKAIGAKDFHSIALGAIVLGVIGGIAVAIGGLLFGPATDRKSDSHVAPSR